MKKRIPGYEEFKEKLKDDEYRKTEEVKFFRSLGLGEQAYKKQEKYRDQITKDHDKKRKERQKTPERRALVKKSREIAGWDIGAKLSRAIITLAIATLPFLGYGVINKVAEKEQEKVEKNVFHDYDFWARPNDPLLIAMAALCSLMILAVFSNRFDIEVSSDIKKAARKILRIERLKEEGSFEKFWNWANSNEDLKREVLYILEDLSKEDRGYIENLLKGGLDDANYPTAMAIILGHLEKHPEEYNKIIEIMNESDLPGLVKFAYGDAYYPNWDEIVRNESDEMTPASDRETFQNATKRVENLDEFNKEKLSRAVKPLEKIG